MSNIILGKVWPLAIPSTPKFVLVSLAEQANDDGLCWPGVESLCKRTQFTDRAVQKALNWLETHGYIARKQRSGRSTYYTVTPERGSPLPPNVVHPEEGSPAPEQRSPTPEPGSPHPEPRSPITITQPSKNLQGTAEAAQDLLFEAVAKECGLDWKRLPKPERGRLNVAVKALREIGATPAEVATHAAAYRTVWPKVSLTPTALAANWAQCTSKPSVATKSPADAAREELESKLFHARNAQRTHKLRPQMQGEDDDTFIARIDREVTDAKFDAIRRTQAGTTGAAA